MSIRTARDDMARMRPPHPLVLLLALVAFGAYTAWIIRGGYDHRAFGAVTVLVLLLFGALGRLGRRQRTPKPSSRR
jgi:hypothetical protein